MARPPSPDHDRKSAFSPLGSALLRRGPCLIALVYLVLGSAWILFSDRWVDALSSDPAVLVQLQSWKGLAFVFVTSVLLYAAMKRFYGAIVHLQQRNQAESERLQRAHRIARLGDWQVDPASGDLIGSAEFYRLLECSPQQWDELVLLFQPEDRTHLEADLRALLRDGTPVERECRLAVKEGQNWFHLRAALTDDGRVAGTLMDITEQRRLLDSVVERETLLSEMAAHMPEVFWIHEPETGLVYVSPAFERIWQQPVQDVLKDRSGWLETVHPEDRQRVEEAFRSSLRRREKTHYEYRVRRAEERWRWIQERVFPITDDDGELLRIIGISEDVTENHRQQEALHRAANYDRLTGLPNRASFHELLEQRCQSLTEDQGFALMFVDLDRFRTINESLGHSAGDELLCKASERMQQVLQSDGTLARLGADEFAVLFNPGHETEIWEPIANRLTKVLAEPFTLLDAETVFVGMNLGVAFWPVDGRDAEHLLKNAEVAMYSARSVGRNQWARFNPGQVAASPESVRLEADIHRAVEEGEFELFFQSQFDVSGRQVAGAECLLRWNHPQRGMVSPGEFIPLLERTGLISEVGLWVIEQACRRINEWRARGLPKRFVVAVNVSARQLNDDGLAESVAELMEHWQVPRDMLELELTESSIMQEPARAQKLFRELRARGVRIAIDDFGTRYSSLNYLRDFAPDILKIDKSFIDHIEEDERAHDLVCGIIDLAHRLDIGVVAEGVETQRQLELLQQGHCDWVQGFLLARPKPLSDFLSLIRDYGALSANAAS